MEIDEAFKDDPTLQ